MMTFFGKIHDFFFPEEKEIEIKNFAVFPNEAQRYREIAVENHEALLVLTRDCNHLKQRVHDLERENQCLREMLAEVKK